MAWITLALRKQTLRAAINEYDMQLLNVSRELRQVARHKTTDVSIFNMQKQQELRDAREKYTDVRDEKPKGKDGEVDYNSKEYREWQENLAQAREDYLVNKEEIEDRYDTEIELTEEEASDKQNALEQEQTMIETQLAAVRAEYEAVDKQVSEEIKSSAIKFE